MKMKKVLFPILAVLLVMAFIPVVGLAADGGPTVYGIKRYSAQIYEIDPTTGAATLEFTATSPVTGGSATPNGLAYDSDNNRFYYATYTGAADLYFYDGTQTKAGDLTGQIACADYYDGKYYYIDGGPPVPAGATDDLYEVDLDETTGLMTSETKVGDIAGGAHGWTFNGDIAISADGVLYGLGLCATDGKYEFFSVNLDGSGFSIIKDTGYTFSLQLAFFGDTLYGHTSTGDGLFYEVDLDTGDLSSAFPNSTEYLYTDLASGPRAVDVYIDIKPTSCPNPLNVNSKGVLPVAILGTEDFDVTEIDVTTVFLEGVPPLRYAYEDVAAPFLGEPSCLDEYACTTDGPDGYLDLTLKFNKQAVVATLGPVSDGDVLCLTLTAELLDETPISASDVIRIIKKR